MGSDNAPLMALGSGVITVNEWLCAPDGRTYLHFFAPFWQLGNEKDVLGRVVRGNSGFFVLSRAPTFVVPGCRFSCFAECALPPPGSNVYALAAEEYDADG